VQPRSSTCCPSAAQLHLPNGCADMAVQLGGGGQGQHHRRRDGAAGEAQQLARCRVSNKGSTTAGGGRHAKVSVPVWVMHAARMHGGQQCLAGARNQVHPPGGAHLKHACPRQDAGALHHVVVQVSQASGSQVAMEPAGGSRTAWEGRSGGRWFGTSDGKRAQRQHLACSPGDGISWCPACSHQHVVRGRHRPASLALPNQHCLLMLLGVRRRQQCVRIHTTHAK